MIKISRILFPTDFSDLSEEALRYSAQFAKDYESVLHVIHVVDEAYQYWMNVAPHAAPIGPGVDEVARSATEGLHRMAAERIGPDIRTVIRVLVGRPYIEIVNYAKTQAIDLIVMGTHGRGGLSHMLLGSVTEKVVRKAPCPVLIVHHPQHEIILP